jgi:hypothetical protein
MSTVLNIALALAAFAQGAIAFAPATRIAAPRTVVAENQMVCQSCDYQAYSPGDYGGIMDGAVVDHLSVPTEGGSNLIVSQFNTSSVGGKLDITTVTCPIEDIHDKSGKFAALGKPKTDSAASNLGEYSGTYTIIASSEEKISNDSDQQLAPFEKKWSYVIADQAEFAKKIEEVKRIAISEDLIGRKIVEQDDGVIVAVYELPAGIHVAFVIRSKVSRALASQIIKSAEDILDDMHLTDGQRLQFRKICLKYSPYTNASNPRGYHVPSLTQEITAKSVIVNCAYSD